MTDPKRPLDLALDVLVYVPVGLAVSAKDLVPKLAEKGRARLGAQVTTAKVIGQFAVQQGQVEAGKALARARQDAERRLAGSPPAPTPPPARRSAPASRVATSGPAADTLAVPDYDSLSASQVLPRLEGLAPDELEAVRAYEAAHRGRKTILGRIIQIQGS